MLLINWLSQKQPTIESSIFGTEFVAMKFGVEALRGIRYKLRMMGIPIAGLTYVYGDNMSVIHNTQQPGSTLKKKNLSICYHTVREAVAMGEILASHVRTKNNFSDFMTKVTYGQKGRHMVGSIFLTFMMTIPIRKADSQKVLLNDCWMSKLVPSKSDLLLRSSNLRGLRKLGRVETRWFLPNLTSLGREGVFFPEQKEASQRE
jgi:hypothetical protein